MNARVSPSAERIIYVSEASRRQHEAIGFSNCNSCVIPNGFDLTHIERDEVQRKKVRAGLGIGPNEMLVGHLARFHRAKDQLTLLRAAREVVRQQPGVKFALAGPGLDCTNDLLVRTIAENALNRQVFLLGETSDPNAFLSGCDVFCLSSSAEGFPNALGEAMACRLPVAATRVGECEEIVGDCGYLVEPRNPDALASALMRIVLLDAGLRMALGDRARERIMQRYSIARVAARYQSLYLPHAAKEDGISFNSTARD
jgi:glycosyltransferase involved in cell wall biosynthesis